MNILITGIHGFVGSNLVGTLAPKHKIYGIDIVAPEKDGVEKTFSWADLEDNKIPTVDAIIHLAGIVHETGKKSESQIYFDINTGLTQKIFDYFSAHSEIKKFIFFSTCATVDKVKGNMLTEDAETCPAGLYGESKLKAEQYIQAQMAANPELYENRQVAILRPSMIHGPGNKGNLNLLYAVVSKGIPWPLGKFDNRRTFTSIDNLCFVIDGMLDKSIPSGIYNMADDEATSTNELIEVICHALGRKAHIWHLSKKFIVACARIGDKLHLPLNTFRLDKLTENYVVSNAKIKQALGIDRMPVRAQDGLAKTIRSFKTVQ
ncbi:MAG: NAD-dependent epimerase/dehydratase family protein [Rikenellaceae bacterium]|jgi:nucleoside-diphosphate-sugar epimerase|nr:NAD-dependent epimerase/dehydratase family protein [Rikenellaceae bacterium]